MSTFAELRSRFASAEPARSLTPLFWVKGEPPEVLLAEIARMDEGGIGGFVVESRTHPAFLDDRWWRDLGAIVDEAARRGMQVWLMDDEHYPSGYAAGVVAHRRPDLLKRYLAERYIDLAGPLPHARFAIGEELRAGEELIAVVAGKRPDHEDGDWTTDCDALDGDQLVDLTESVDSGLLRWPVPAGAWRLFVIVATREGGEEWTRDFVDPLCEEAVDLYIETVHAATFRHIGEHFGATFQGFFTDEPRLGNAANYTSMPGQAGQVLPYTRGLLADFEARAGYSLRQWLPALWHDCGPRTANIRHDYMDLVSARFATAFMARIGNWCREHRVRFIGHLVEDNGAHARLGFGAGHYFRNAAALDMGGLDVVGYQVRPGFTHGQMAAAFGTLDLSFFNWALVKLASSVAHHTPRMGGLTMAEAYGAFGWAEGLKLMKWLTDWMCVRGVNVIVPHAFSPAAFPDPDCPPHFYAGGHNPQWRFFRAWADYANRTCSLLTNGQHVAEVLVLYTAESSWAGPADGCEHVIAMLAETHLDCDICSYEDFCDHEKVSIMPEGQVRCGDEQYAAVLLPQVERVPAAVLERMIAARKAGVHVACLGGVPRLPCRDADRNSVALLAGQLEMLIGPASARLTYAEWGRALRAGGLGDVSPEEPATGLRHYHYRYAGIDLYFLTNESVHETVDAWIRFRAAGHPELWDPLAGSVAPAPFDSTGEATRVHIRLEPYESAFLAFDASSPSGRGIAISPQATAQAGDRRSIDGPWEVSRSTAEEYPAFTAEPSVQQLGDWTAHDGLQHFAGTLRYQTAISIPEAWHNRELTLDLGEAYELVRVRLDGLVRGLRICPPYRCTLGAVAPGTHALEIEVTNTLAAQVPDPFSRVVAAEPSGLLGPIALCVEGLAM
jgi:hypothetical protein